MRGSSAEPYAFVDRREDLRSVLAFCREEDRQKPRCLLLKGHPGSGVTCFLKHLKSLVGEFATPVYADLARETEREVVAQFFIEHSKRRLNLLAEPVDWRRLTAALLKGLGAVAFPLSWLRPVLAVGTDLAQPIIFTPFESQPLEQFSRIVRSPRSKRTVLFFLDNAQGHYTKIEGLLATAHAPEYDHVRFVIAFITEDHCGESYTVFREHVLTSFQSVSELEFSGLNQELVKELAAARNLHLNAGECENLIKQSAFNVWRLLGLLRGDNPKEEVVSPMDAYILRLLIVAGQSIRRSDLWALSVTSPLVHVDSEDTWNATLKRLVLLRLVEEAKHEAVDTSIALGTGSQPKVAALARDGPGNLPVIQELYDYFDKADAARTPRHPVSYTAPLLYRLSRQIDPARQALRAQKLVEAALAQGSMREAKRYIDEACKGGATSLHDQFLQLAFFVACLDFERAAEMLKILGGSTIRRHRILRLLQAVTLNRVRSHSESLLEIDRLMADPQTSCHELSVLASYKAAGLLHEGRWNEAVQFVDQMRRSLMQAKGYGYFLRNAAAVFMWDECMNWNRAEGLLTEAVGAMRATQDAFGECTVVNNQGVLACYRHDFEGGLRLFQEAHSGLRVYGTHHLDEVGANVGLGLLRVGRIEDAKTHLLRYSRLTEWDLPRCFAENALALAEWLLGDSKAAMRRIQETMRESAHVKVIEAHQRTLYNAALVEAVTNGASDQFKHLLHDLRIAQWTAESEIASLEASANGGAISSKNTCELWSLDYCQYWSQNPLALLPHELLTL